MILGLTGRKQSGKSTLALALARRGWCELSFAAPIRVLVASLIGVTLSELERVKEVPHPVLGGRSPRFAMQTLGTEWGRQMISPGLWVDSLMGHATRLRDASMDVVISDVRFPNEAEAILAAGGRVVEVVRPGAGEVDAHISEAGIPAELISGRIFNNKSPEDLTDVALCLVGALRKKEISG